VGTPYSEIFDAYFVKVKDDLYTAMKPAELELELIKVMEAALPRFLYPKVNLDNRSNTSKTFDDTLTSAEIQIIATLMNVIWAESKCSDIEVARQLYRDHDFQLTSQASHLRALLALRLEVKKLAKRMMDDYSKVKDRKPDFSSLAGGKGE
jgi:predicted component of type VI protein secretion system